jgi:hypothetical protein
MLLSFSFEASAQSFVKNGSTFEQVSTRSTGSKATKTQFNYKDSKGKDYPIFITQNGRCFVNKVSAKTGREYKYYLNEDISKAVCKELGITYTPKKSKS